jgi:hypothetical protein
VGWKVSSNSSTEASLFYIAILDIAKRQKVIVLTMNGRSSIVSDTEHGDIIFHADIR